MKSRQTTSYAVTYVIVILTINRQQQQQQQQSFIRAQQVEQ